MKGVNIVYVNIKIFFARVIILIIGGSASQNLAAKVANLLHDRLCPIETHKFPDGERYIRIKGEIPDEVVVIQSTGYPQDENFMELFLIIKTLKDIGADKVKAVIPYLGYSRQDKRFKPGEAVSVKIIAELLEAAGADEVFSVNLHEHNIIKFFNIPAHELSAIPLLAKHLSPMVDDPIIVAPDKGALAHAKTMAEIIGCEYDYMEKVRISPEKVETRLKSFDVEGRSAIIVDDIISTGGTIVNAARILRSQGANDIKVACVHAVLVDDALLKIFSVGVDDVIATDTIKSEVSRVSVAPLIVEALKWD